MAKGMLAVLFGALPAVFAFEWWARHSGSASAKTRRTLAWYCCLTAGAGAAGSFWLAFVCMDFFFELGLHPIEVIRLLVHMSWFLVMALVFAWTCVNCFPGKTEKGVPGSFWKDNPTPYVTVSFAGVLFLAAISASALLDTVLQWGEGASFLGLWTQGGAQRVRLIFFAAAGVVTLWLCLRVVRVHSGESGTGSSAARNAKRTLWQGLRSPYWRRVAPRLIFLLALGFGVLVLINEAVPDSQGPLGGPPDTVSFAERIWGSHVLQVAQLVAGVLALLLAWKASATLRLACGAGSAAWGALWPEEVLTEEVAVRRLLGLELGVDEIAFRTQEEIEAHLAGLAGVEVERIGASREGAPLFGMRFGQGPRAVSILAGNHADEPAGPMTAQALPALLSRHFPELLEAFRFHVIPQTNPDGARRNRDWFLAPATYETYHAAAVREAPGDDIEYGFDREQGVRLECAAVQDFLSDEGPYHAHFSLHGMAVSEGVWWLVGESWADRAAPLMDAVEEFCTDVGTPLLDVDRKGEKGFRRLRPGFSTAPSAAAMQAHFDSLGDTKTAALFRPSSTEFVTGLGGDPLCMVSEVPLFRISGEGGTPEAPRYQAFLKEATRIRDLDPEARTEALEDLMIRHELAPVPFALQLRLQLAMIVFALLHVRDAETPLDHGEA